MSKMDTLTDNNDKPATSHFSGLQLDQPVFTRAFSTYSTKRLNSPMIDDHFEKFYNKTKYMVEAPLILMNIEQISK